MTDIALEPPIVEQSEVVRRKRRTPELVESAASHAEALRSSALQPGDARNHFYVNHPVTKNEVSVATDPLKEAYDLVEAVVVHRDPGTCLLAAFRVGKTTAIYKIVSELSKTFPELPVGKAFAKGHDAFTQNTFFSDLLLDFKHAGALRGTAQEKRLRLFNMFVSQARQKNSDRYLLLVDEGQNWGAQQWTWLRDLANDLLENKVRLITVTFGQTDEMQSLRQRLVASHRSDLVGRFLLRPMEFRGLRDAKELAHTLAAYDDPMQHQYPASSGISLSEFFMPLAWRAGWRLQQEADLMWTKIADAAQGSHQTPINVGMNWIGGTIRHFLFSQSALDGAGFAGSPEAWGEAVAASGYESTLF